VDLGARAAAQAHRDGLRAVEADALVATASARWAGGDPAAALRDGQLSLTLADDCGVRLSRARAHGVLSRAWTDLGEAALAAHHRRLAQALGLDAQDGALDRPLPTWGGRPRDTSPSSAPGR